MRRAVYFDERALSRALVVDLVGLHLQIYRNGLVHVALKKYNVLIEVVDIVQGIAQGEEIGIVLLAVGELARLVGIGIVVGQCVDRRLVGPLFVETLIGGYRGEVEHQPCKFIGVARSFGGNDEAAVALAREHYLTGIHVGERLHVVDHILQIEYLRLDGHIRRFAVALYRVSAAAKIKRVAEHAVSYVVLHYARSSVFGKGVEAVADYRHGIFFGLVKVGGLKYSAVDLKASIFVSYPVHRSREVVLHGTVRCGKFALVLGGIAFAVSGRPQWLTTAGGLCIFVIAARKQRKSSTNEEHKGKYRRQNLQQTIAFSQHV